MVETDTVKLDKESTKVGVKEINILPYYRVL